MMGTSETGYQQFGVDDNEEAPQGMIHIVPEAGKATRWNHIVDLDNFFTRVYKYHQRHGFACMMIQEVLELFQFVFVVVFSIFLFNCVDYPVLFRDVPKGNKTKLTLDDVVFPPNQCVSNMGLLSWSIVIISIIFWILRAIKVVYHLFQYWDVKAFFEIVLKIYDNDLENVTWHEVQKRLREVQLEQQMCIHKRELTELDIYHRILRFKNYMVAMVNKSLLPARFNVPLIGEVVYLSHGLKYNIEMLLFWLVSPPVKELRRTCLEGGSVFVGCGWFGEKRFRCEDQTNHNQRKRTHLRGGPWSPFENNWHLKEDYKKVYKRHELAAALAKNITYVALANLLLCPIILLWQILYSFFSYAEMLKREPGTLGVRRWSLYGRLYLRHFNELDHELNSRLNRAYRPATKYMNIFTSPVVTVIAKNIVFVCGACLAVLLALSIYDEDVLTVEHVLSAITVLGAIVASFRVLIPDEHLIWWPEHLMNAVLAHVHYLPARWKGFAHTRAVRAEFTQLFQYTATYLLMELISPIATPLLLFFYLKHRALDLVDFYRSFTVEVAGVGDVCSFAQMDVREHGDPSWNNLPPPSQAKGTPPSKQNYYQAEEGKTELSLIHFTLTNPNWTPPTDCNEFVSGVREQAKRQFLNEYPMSTTMSDEHSLGMPGHPGVSTILNSTDHGRIAMSGVGGNYVIHASRNEGPVMDRFFQPHSGLPPAPSIGASVFGLNERTGLPGTADLLESNAMDMSINAIYLHQMHHRTMHRRGMSSLGPSEQQRPPGGSLYSQERTPLLRPPSHLS